MSVGAQTPWWLLDERRADHSKDSRTIARQLDEGLLTICPALVDHVAELEDAVAAQYRQWREVSSRSADRTGEPPTTLADPLRALLVNALNTGMAVAAAAEARRLEAAIDEELTTGTVSLEDSVNETFAAQYARRAVERQAVDYDAAAVAHLKHNAAMESSPEATDELIIRNVAAEIAESHPPVVARATTLSAARYGVQAFAEQCGLIGGKEWVVPAAGCPFHESMDGQRVPVDRCFTVVTDGPSAPHTSFVAGEGCPANCPCVQRATLADLETHDPRFLATYDGVSVTAAGQSVPPLSGREREVFLAHRRPDETFQNLLERVHEEHSVRGGARDLGVAKKTLYRWFDSYIDGFDRYSGR